MMKKGLPYVFAIAMIASVVLLTGCGEKSENGEKEKEKIYVIYSDNAFAPFEYFDTENNTYIGIDMDLMEAIAEDQGFKYEMHNEGFKAAIDAVQNGQADAMIAGISITEEREETFDFSDAYFSDGQVFVAREGTGMEDLMGKTVAAMTSTLCAKYAESIKDEYGFTVNYYEDTIDMYQAVQNGTDAACVEDFSAIGYAIKTGEVNLTIISEEPVNIKGYGLAVQKDMNSELIRKFNVGLANIKASGKFNEILAKYGY